MPSQERNILQIYNEVCQTEAEVLESDDLFRFLQIIKGKVELTLEDISTSSAAALQAFRELMRYRGIILNKGETGVLEFLKNLEGMLLEKCMREADGKRANIYYDPEDLAFFKRNARSFMNRGYLPIIHAKSGEDGNPFGEAIYPFDDTGEGSEEKSPAYITLVKLPKGMEYCNLSKPPSPDEVMAKIDTTEGLGFSEANEGSHVSMTTVDYKRTDGNRIIPESIEWNNHVTVPRGSMNSEFLEQNRQYGTALFEGIGVERAANGDILIFRLDDHAKRMSEGGEYYDMPPIPDSMYHKMVIDAVKANAKYLPPHGKGRLYIRPNWFDKGRKMHIGSSNFHALTMTAVTIGNMESYFEKGRKVFFLPENIFRATENGAGQTKGSGVYASSIRPNYRAKEKGMAGVLYTNEGGNRIEETLASSFIRIIRKKGEIILETPSLEHKSILDSITRKTILELAEKELGWEVLERDINLEEMTSSDIEILGCFAIGTGAGLAPMHAVRLGSFNNESGEIENLGEEIKFWEYDAENPWGNEGKQLMELLLKLKSGELPGYEKYLTKV